MLIAISSCESEMPASKLVHRAIVAATSTKPRSGGRRAICRARSQAMSVASARLVAMLGARVGDFRSIVACAAITDRTLFRSCTRWLTAPPCPLSVRFVSTHRGWK